MRLPNARLAWAAGIVGLGLPAAVAMAALPQQSGTVDLLTQANVTIQGAAAYDWAGYAVDAAGDMNADGIDDVIIGAYKADPLGRTDAGAAYVVFGSRTPTTVNLASPGTGAMVISGAAADDGAGRSVAGVGDFNRDGIDDVAVGAWYADPLGRTNAGAAYVIYGSASPADVDLASLGSRGITVSGGAVSDYAGRSIAGTGDVNADGIDDLIVGADGADLVSPTVGNAGSGFVIYGSASPVNVDLAAALGSAGFRVNGSVAFGSLGLAVGGAGDFNNDGKNDVMVASWFLSPLARSLAGATYVVYGSATSPGTVSVGSLGSRGIAINGAAASDYSGTSVSGAGDINDDGIDDVVVGAPLADPGSLSAAGTAYVLFGSGSPVDVDLASPPASAGFLINGGASADQTGTSVDGAGDLNGDGIDDVAVGSPGADPSSRSAAGEVEVVYGSQSPTNTTITSITAAVGWRVFGAAANGSAGQAVAGAGDINGDGRDDLLIGANGADFNGSTSGGAYEVFGFGISSLSYAAPVSGTAGQALAPVTPTAARTGAATFTVAPALPPGLTIDPQTGTVSGTPSGASPTSQHTVTMTDLLGQVTAPLQVTVADAPVAPVVPSSTSGSGGATPSGGSTPTAPALTLAAPTVVHTTAGRGVLSTRVTVNEPGRLAQIGTRRTAIDRTAAACSYGRTIRRPGTYTLACRLNAQTMRVLARRSLRVTLTTRFTAASGARVQRVTVVRITRIAPRRIPVTG